MKTAFSFWGQRIAPVFDTAELVFVVETDARKVIREAEERLPGDPPIQKARRLAELGVHALVCGAVSRPLHGLLLSYGIQVMAFVTGELRTVVDAWLDGGLDWRQFAMPGCGAQHGRRFRQMYGASHATIPAPGIKGRQAGRAGGGQGRARGGRRGGGRFGPFDGCVCSECGYLQPFERGKPCWEQICPRCGIPMTRR
jgi:predicted Fe-Mo cluster-binding NifX family protein